MDRIKNYLLGLTGKVFRLLPMLEDEIEGKKNHRKEYLENLIITIEGGLDSYPCLAENEKYLYVLNDLHYLNKNDVEFKKYRSLILNASAVINNIWEQFEMGVKDE